MKEFFKNQLETLHARTGIRQLENLMQNENWKKEVEVLIDFMIEECNRPPFDKVKPEVRQRVIERAIVEDKDFIGLNAKFVRRALNAWWEVNGDRVLMALNEKEASVYDKVQLTPEQNEFVDTMLESYKRRLQAEAAALKPVPKMERKEFERVGAEWKSGIEKGGHSKGIPYSTEEDHKRKDLHLQYCRENYDLLTGQKLSTWIEESEWLKRHNL